MADAYLPIMLAFPPEKNRLSAKNYDKEIRAFVKQLAEIPAATWTKQVSKQNLLEVLDPAVNSIPYLLSLNRQIDTVGKSRDRLEPLLSLAAVFLNSCDPVQMRYVGESWRSLFRSLLQGALSEGTADLTPLVSALFRIDPSGGTFTINHLRLVKSCLQLGIPSQALPILDKPIYAYPQSMAKTATEDLWSDEHELSCAYITSHSGFTTSLSAENVLEYYYLGGCIYIGARKYNRARLFLEHVILSPSIQHTVSIFQVEAYKKWVLLGLLAQGHTYPIPRTADSTVLKSVHSIAKSYDALSESFEKREWTKFQAEALTGGPFWSEDGNMRLVRDVGDALLRHRVTDLQDTYAALPVSRVAMHLGLAPDETLQLLREMIEQRFLNAALLSTGPGPVLRFNAQSASSVPAADLDEQTKRIASLVAFVHDADRRLQLTKEYVDHQKRNKRSGGPDGDLADAMDLSWDAPMVTGLDDDGDEDLMSR